MEGAQRRRPAFICDPLAFSTLRSAPRNTPLGQWAVARLGARELYIMRAYDCHCHHLVHSSSSSDLYRPTLPPHPDAVPYPWQVWHPNAYLQCPATIMCPYETREAFSALGIFDSELQKRLWESFRAYVQSCLFSNWAHAAGVAFVTGNKELFDSVISNEGCRERLSRWLQGNGAANRYAMVSRVLQVWDADAATSFGPVEAMASQPPPPPSFYSPPLPFCMYWKIPPKVPAFICDPLAYTTLSLATPNTPLGQWAIARLAAGELYIMQPYDCLCYHLVGPGPNSSDYYRPTLPLDPAADPHPWKFWEPAERLQCCATFMCPYETREAFHTLGIFDLELQKRLWESFRAYAQSCLYSEQADHSGIVFVTGNKELFDSLISKEGCREQLSLWLKRNRAASHRMVSRVLQVWDAGAATSSGPPEAMTSLPTKRI